MTTSPHLPRPNWWSRNWKWFVPTGCLVLLILGFGMVALFITAISRVMKSSDVYKLAMAKAQSNPAVIERLGTPIESGFFISGNIKVQNASGDANISIPISGPKGKGTVYADATKRAGVWEFSSLIAEAGGERVNLLE